MSDHGKAAEQLALALGLDPPPYADVQTIAQALRRAEAQGEARGLRRMIPSMHNRLRSPEAEIAANVLKTEAKRLEQHDEIMKIVEKRDDY